MRRLLIILLVFALVILSFQTVPSAGNGIRGSKSDSILIHLPKKSLKFIVLGDWGRNGDYHQSDVAEEMNVISMKYGVDFYISTGDNFYDNGIRSVNDPLWTTSFENIYHGGALQRDWYVVLGNHDYHG